MQDDDNDKSISPVEQIAKLLYDRVIEDANKVPSPVREFANEQHENAWWNTASSEEITEQVEIQELIENYWQRN